VSDIGFGWNYTTWPNLGFLAVAALLVWRSLRTGGPAMLRQMEQARPASTRIIITPDGTAGDSRPGDSDDYCF
jgi:hypothetical protein